MLDEEDTVLIKAGHLSECVVHTLHVSHHVFALGGRLVVRVSWGPLVQPHFDGVGVYFHDGACICCVCVATPASTTPSRSVVMGV